MQAKYAYDSSILGLGLFSLLLQLPLKFDAQYINIQIIRDIPEGGVNTMSHRLYLHFETLFLVLLEVNSFV
jgi:hypothetical protein